MNVRLPVLLLVACPASIAGEPAAVRAAQFYAQGLEQPLLQLRQGALLIQACKKHLRRACSREQRELAASDRTIELLDALTLFPQRPVQNPVDGIARPAELAGKIADTSTALLRVAGEYDRQLFARYGAVLQVCPAEDATTFRDSLVELVRIDLTGFQSLADEELARVSDAIAREESAWAAKLRTVPAEDCVGARKLGEYLMQLMHAKLQPWSGEDRRVANQTPSFEFGSPEKPSPEVPRAEIAYAVAGNFVSVVATELQLTVFPESEARIRAIGGHVSE
jgi:hypothetical protein